MKSLPHHRATLEKLKRKYLSYEIPTALAERDLQAFFKLYYTTHKNNATRWTKFSHKSLPNI